MTDPDHFLARWSRRKSEQRREANSGEPSPATPSEPAAQVMPKAASTDVTGPAEGREPVGDGIPAFDPASLPSIESIVAETDIRAFLRPGVPAELRNAALRRAWSVDPAIRNFKGLAENDWDFNDPNVPGFGPLSPDLDVKKMAEALFGDGRKRAQKDDEIIGDQQAAVAKDKSVDAVGEGSSEAALAEAGNGIPSESPPAQDDLLQRDTHIATQNKNSASDAAPVKRRRSHGGALPQS